MKLILTFSLTLMVGNVFQQLYTVVDTMVVGKVLGGDAMAALGAAELFSHAATNLPIKKEPPGWAA